MSDGWLIRKVSDRWLIFMLKTTWLGALFLAGLVTITLSLREELTLSFLNWLAIVLFGAHASARWILDGRLQKNAAAMGVTIQRVNQIVDEMRAHHITHNDGPDHGPDCDTNEKEN